MDGVYAFVHRFQLFWNKRCQAPAEAAQSELDRARVAPGISAHHSLQVGFAPRDHGREKEGMDKRELRKECKE